MSHDSGRRANGQACGVLVRPRTQTNGRPPSDRPVPHELLVVRRATQHDQLLCRRSRPSASFTKNTPASTRAPFLHAGPTDRMAALLCRPCSSTRTLGPRGSTPRARTARRRGRRNAQLMRDPSGTIRRRRANSTVRTTELSEMGSSSTAVHIAGRGNPCERRRVELRHGGVPFGENGKS